MAGKEVETLETDKKISLNPLKISTFFSPRAPATLTENVFANINTTQAGMNEMKRFPFTPPATANNTPKMMLLSPQNYDSGRSRKNYFTKDIAILRLPHFLLPSRYPIKHERKLGQNAVFGGILVGEGGKQNKRNCDVFKCEKIYESHIKAAAEEENEIN